MSIRSVLILMCCASLSCLTGCTEQATRFPVAGKVLIDGEPVATGSIQFVPEDGRPVASKISKDGSFRLIEMSVSSEAATTGVLEGKYRIGVSSSEVLDEDQGEILRHIPGRYADFRTSDLDVVISEPREDMVIKLTWEGAEETETATETEIVVEGSSAENEVVKEE